MAINVEQKVDVESACVSDQFSIYCYQCSGTPLHANLDMSKSMVHKGTVVRYGWSMPHVYMKVNAPNSKGEIVEYSIEMLHPLQ